MPTIYNKVTANGETLIDLSQDTVTSASHIVSGYVGHLADGTQVTGTGSGGSSDTYVEKPVKFYDYDGTILHEYTIAEAKALTALPANPTHTGLTAEGWNWTLAELKEYATNYPDADINIGQTYITSDGATKLHITIDNNTLHPYLALAVNGTIAVDWGDNTTPDTMTGNSDATIFQDHEYSSAGNYIISISVDSGRFTFTVNSQNYGSILRCGDAFYDASCWLYSSTIKKIFLGENARLGQYAFCYLLNLTECSISKNTIVSSTSSLFYYCTKLKHLNFGFSLSAPLQYLYSLKSLSIPKQSATSQFYSPKQCSILESITIPDNVTSMSEVLSLHAIRKLVLPDSLTTLQSLYYLYSLEQIVTKNTSLTFTATSAFSNCSTLKEITFNIIFTHSSGIGSCFSSCYNLNHINYSYTGSSTTTGNTVFNNCYCLKEIILPATITTIGQNCLQNCKSLVAVEIPSNVTTIGSSAFYGCSSLQSIIIPNKVTSLGASCFSSCYKLASVTLSNTLTTLESSCFGNCYSLTSLTIPATVTNIGNSCFSSCTYMQEYHFLPTSPPALGTSVFSSITSGCKIYVPYSADHSILNAYKTATNWSTYASHIEEEPQS